MKVLNRFEVVLMPQREVLASGLTLAEAVAYVSGYEEANGDGACEAVIALPDRPAVAASSRRRRGSSAAHGRRTEPAIRLA
jgi:hypothetical protein